MLVDIYTHIFPDRFFQELERGSPKLGNMGKRLRAVRKLFDLDARFRDMDEIGITIPLVTYQKGWWVLQGGVMVQRLNLQKHLFWVTTGFALPRRRH